MSKKKKKRLETYYSYPQLKQKLDTKLDRRNQLKKKSFRKRKNTQERIIHKKENWNDGQYNWNDR